MDVAFTTTLAENLLIDEVVARAAIAGLVKGRRYSRLDLRMDLTATHSNGCPLDFHKLLQFNDFNFTHDIAGIARHLDRSTGELRGCFLPRCAK